ncbi:MAG: C2 family cysteine protease, partial [Myxococcota bacterium]|nr:C2 family cysteine protease [Myxococcota bacterium]
MSSCTGTPGKGVNNHYAGEVQSSAVNSNVEVDVRANTKDEASLPVKKDGYAKGVKQGKYRQRLENPTTDVKDTELKVLIDPFAPTSSSNTWSLEYKNKLSRLLGNNFFSKQTRGHWDAIATRFNLDQRVLKTNPAFNGESQYGDAGNWAEVDASSMWNVELWGGSGINASEICQNDLGDCYFLSALASIALSDPGAIENMISYDPETDLYTVTFAGVAYDESGSVVPSGEMVEIVIDDELLQKVIYDDNGEVLGYGDVGASMTDTDGDGVWEIGVALIEKAYALYVDQMNALAEEQGQPPFFGDIDPNNASGYDLLNEGGFMETALISITGEQHNWSPVTMIGEDWGGGLSSEEWLMDLLSAADEGVNVCVGSMVDCDLEGLVGGHAYTVLGLVEVEGEMMVALRNPWGVGEPAGNGDNDGVFLLTMDEFHSNFDQIAFNSETYFSSDWSSHELASFSDAVNGYAAWADLGELDLTHVDGQAPGLPDTTSTFIDFINNPNPHTGQEFSERMDALMQQFPHGNIMDVLMLVFMESIKDMNEDKKYFLKKLMMYNKMGEGLSRYLQDVLLPAS